MIETYVATDIPYVDTKVASAMCKGGAVVYIVLEESGITDEWICAHIVPHIVELGFALQVCIVLGRALLWRLHPQTSTRATRHSPERLQGVTSSFGCYTATHTICGPVTRSAYGISRPQAR